MKTTVRPLDDEEAALLLQVWTELGQAPRLLPMTARRFADFLEAHVSTHPTLVDGPDHMGVLRAARKELSGQGYLETVTALDLKAFLESAPPMARWEIETIGP